jgi:hypothetical protein
VRARLTTRVADGGAGPSNEGPVRPSCPARFTVPTPPHDTTFRSFALALAAVPLVAACSPNPGDWVKARWEPMAALTQRCPNLEGTYTMAGGARPPMSQTIFGSYVTGGNRRFPWETMTIAGQGDDSLVLTLARSQRQRDAFRDAVFARGAYYEREYRRMHSPSGRWSSGFATMTDSAYGANLETLYLAPVRSYTLRRGEHHTCKGGWLRVDRVVHDPGPDRNNPRPDTVVGEVLLRKGWKGDLVAMAKVREAREFTVWCGDGCKGIPLGTWTARTWGRWRSSAVASDGPSPRPWAEPFEAPPLSRAPTAASTPPEAIADALRPMLPSGARLQTIERDGSGYRAQIASHSTHAHGGVDRLLAPGVPLPRRARPWNLPSGGRGLGHDVRHWRPVVRLPGQSSRSHACGVGSPSRRRQARRGCRVERHGGWNSRSWPTTNRRSMTRSGRSRDRRRTRPSLSRAASAAAWVTS